MIRRTQSRSRDRLITKLVISLAGTLLMSSCIHSYYLPNSHNVPLLTKKKDARLSAAYYSGLQTGYEFQGSYAVTNNIGIVANAMVVSATDLVSSINNSLGTTYKIDSRIRYFDFGGGYYKSLNPHIIFEAYGGAGLGYSKNTFENSSYNEANFTKFYAQPSFGYKSKIFDLAISWRLSALNFTSFENTGLVSTGDLAEIQLYQSSTSSILSEPALTARLGYDLVKLQAQYGWSFNLSHPNLPLEGKSSYLSLGIFFTIAGREKQK